MSFPFIHHSHPFSFVNVTCEFYKIDMSFYFSFFRLIFFSFPMQKLSLFLSLPHYVSFMREESCHLVHCRNLAPGRVPGTQWALDTYLVNKGLSVYSRLRIVFPWFLFSPYYILLRKRRFYRRIRQ